MYMFCPKYFMAKSRVFLILILVGNTDMMVA